MSRRVDRQVRTLWDKEQEELRESYKKYLGNIHRGDIFYFDKGQVTGVEQQGGRPGVIVSNDACNNSSDFLLVCYLTTQPKTNLPTHVSVMCEQESICLCEQVHTLSKEKMRNYYCTCTPEEMAEIDKALVITLGIDLKNVSSEGYEDLLKQIEEKNKELEQLKEVIAEKDEKILSLENDIQCLENKLKAYREKTESKLPIECTPEYVKACAERDVYIKLYNDLLNQIY